MNVGLYQSVEGVVSRTHQLDVLSNNLANVNTTGFKPDAVVIRERPIARLERSTDADPQLLLEKLGGGLRVNPTVTDFEQGSLETDRGPLDVAILGKGFLRFETGDGVALSRDGRLLRAPDGTLVSATTGDPVLGETGRPILLPDWGRIEISTDGLISHEGAPLERLSLVDVADTRDLRKTSSGRFETDAPLLQSEAQVRQYTLEASGTDAVEAMARLVQLQRAIEQNTRLIQYQDAMNGQAATVLGRPA